MPAVPSSTPSVEVVVTMWLPSLCASMRGMKVREPYTGPQKLTPMPQSQSLSVPSLALENSPTPALLTRMCTGPNLLLDLVGLALPGVAIHDVVHHRGDARIIGGEVLQCIVPLLVVEIAQDHLRALLMQRARDAKADAAGAAGDVGDLVLHVGDGRRLRWTHVRVAVASSALLPRRVECMLAEQSGSAGRGDYAGEHLAAIQILVVHRCIPRLERRS